MSEGEQLTGDGVTQRIVRIGDTVRLRLTPDASPSAPSWSATATTPPGNVVFRDGLPAALIDFDLAKPTTGLYHVANALWYRAPLRDPRDQSPAFADAYGMTAKQRAGLAPQAVGMVRRYHQDSRASAGLDPVFGKLWEDGAKIYLPRGLAFGPGGSNRCAGGPG